MATYRRDELGKGGKRGKCEESAREKRRGSTSGDSVINAALRFQSSNDFPWGNGALLKDLDK